MNGRNLYQVDEEQASAYQARLDRELRAAGRI